MPLIQLVILLAVLGLVVWAVITYIPMPEVIKRIIIAVVVIVLIIWLLQVFGLIGNLTSIRIGK
jgi:hypothetical protein